MIDTSIQIVIDLVATDFPYRRKGLFSVLPLAITPPSDHPLKVYPVLVGGRSVINCSIV